MKLRNYILSSTDIVFKNGSYPIISNLINYLLTNRIVRIILEKMLKIHRDADLPLMNSNNIKKRFEK